MTQEYVGRAFFDADTFEHSPKRIENLFGSEFLYLENSTPWLSHVTEDPDEFARVLDRLKRPTLRPGRCPPPTWKSGKAQSSSASLSPSWAAAVADQPRS
ncbi:MAG: hypothetical protein R2873_21115 [Caldilineaceae bacterium]